MKLITRATIFIAAISLATAAAIAQSAPAAKKTKPDLEPITIELGDNPPAPKSTPASRTAPAAGTAARTGDAATAQMGEAVSEMYNTKMSRLKPALARWQGAITQVQNSGGITPDFASERDLDSRIATFERAQEETEFVVRTIEQNFSRFEADLRAAGVPEDKIKSGATVLLKDVQTIMNRMKAAQGMIRTGIEALKLLKAQSGNWKAVQGEIDYDVDFPFEEKVRYNSLVQRYKQESAALQQLSR